LVQNSGPSTIVVTRGGVDVDGANFDVSFTGWSAHTGDVLAPWSPWHKKDV